MTIWILVIVITLGSGKTQIWATEIATEAECLDLASTVQEPSLAFCIDVARSVG